MEWPRDRTGSENRSLSVVSAISSHDEPMSLFTDHPRARWAAPAAAVAVVGATTLISNYTARAGSIR